MTTTNLEEKINLNDLLDNNFKEYCDLRDQALKEGYAGYPHFHKHKLFAEWKKALLSEEREAVEADWRERILVKQKETRRGKIILLNWILDKKPSEKAIRERLRMIENPKTWRKYYNEYLKSKD